MKMIVCIDDRGGMLFNGRRLSSDKAVTARILQMCAGNRLWVNSYTQRLFTDDGAVCCSDQPAQMAKAGEYCFGENWDVTEWIPKAEELILFWWNRAYPADLYFPIAVLQSGWQQIYREEFPGNSHTCITMEVYRR